MKLRALAIPVSIVVLGAVTPLRDSVAAAKVDLEAYLGGAPMQDDNKTFVTEGDEFTDTAIGVTPGAKRTVLVFETVHGDVTSQELEVVLHGKSLLRGTLIQTRIQNNVTDEIAFVTPKPKKVVAFKLVPNRAYKFKIGAKVFFNGVKVAKATEYGSTTFLGFEDVVTPLGTFPGAAHFMRTDNVRLKSGKDVFEIKDQIETWIDADLGTVRFIQSEDQFDNGVLSDSIPPQTWLFDHGVIQGVPVGPPMATGGASGSSGATAVARGAAAGSDLMNADAGASITAQAPEPGALVATRASGGSQIAYLPGIDYSGPLSDANTP